MSVRERWSSAVYSAMNKSLGIVAKFSDVQEFLLKDS